MYIFDFLSSIPPLEPILERMEQSTPTEIATWVGLIGSALTVALQIITIVNTNYKAERDRRWRLEDEDRAQKLTAKLEADKEELARQTRHSVRDANNNLSLHFEEVKQSLEDVKKEATDRLREIRGLHEVTQRKIEENTEISKEAFKEANGVNAKLLNLGVALNDIPKEVVVVNNEPIPVTETK